MAQLTAFVGHSFSKADEDVVSRVLRTLDSIAGLMPEFSWDHAQNAEPKLLSQKVLEKMEGKNVFIGICTVKERTVDPDRLHSGRWFKKGTVSCEQQYVGTKTSDWILQEIGMAFGRGLKIVLLLEDGVRVPGGLQGDLEYIPLDRSRPELCLEKLAEMLRSLSPVSPSNLAAQPSAATQSTTDTKGDLDSDSDALNPTGSWKVEDFNNGYRMSIRTKDSAAEVRIRTAFEQASYSKDSQAAATFSAIGIAEVARVRGGEWSSGLRELVSAHPGLAAPRIELARLLEEGEEYAAAAIQFAEASDSAQKLGSKIFLNMRAADCFRRAKDQESSARMVEATEAIVRTNAELEVDGMSALARYWKLSENWDLYFGCAERALEIAPDKVGLRFDLAHEYGEASENVLAAFHYRQHLKVQDYSGAWNNLGVAVVSSDLPVTAIDAYRRAQVDDDGLASSNLAFAFLAAGFLKEARETCESAIEKGMSNPRLYEARARCEVVTEEEAKRERDILNATVLRREFYRKLGQASVGDRVVPFPGKWRSPKAVLVATISGQNLRLEGSYTSKGALSSLLAEPESDEYWQRSTTFVGKLHGRAFVGFSQDQSASRESLLGDDEGKPFIGVFDTTFTRLDLLEGNKKHVLLTAVTEN